MSGDWVDCATCIAGMPEGECPKSPRPCGHHCDHSWTHDICHYCGKEFLDESDAEDAERGSQ